MDTIRIAGAQSNSTVDETLKPVNGRRTPETEIRVLEDWELALAGGGDDAPCWP
jgi:hypothetical protein